MKQRIAVLGGGSWGATLADVLAKNGHDVAVWEIMEAARNTLKNTRSLSTMPQLKLQASVMVTGDLNEALRDRFAVVSAVPSEFVRATWKSVRESKGFPAKAWVVSVTKGIENNTLKRMSEVIEEELPDLKNRVAVLSGPSHAEEVAMGIPTAVVAAGPNNLGEQVQAVFNADRFRVYSSQDFTGVELGGALKNIYAIATGACDGLGLGDNTKAALMTRGLNEMTRIGIASGAHGLTFFGLSGLGDLIVTCGSQHSRNRLLGEKIGKGKNLKEALGEMTMVAEGVRTTKSVYDLARRLDLDLPVVNEIYKCLHEGKTAKASLHDLMHRPVADEMVHVEHIFKP